MLADIDEALAGPVQIRNHHDDGGERNGHGQHHWAAAGTRDTSVVAHRSQRKDGDDIQDRPIGARNPASFAHHKALLLQFDDSAGVAQEDVNLTGVLRADGGGRLPQPVKEVVG